MPYAKQQFLDAYHRKYEITMRDEQLSQKVHFITGPKKMGETSRLDFARFLLSDQIHHLGQFSVYLRMANAKVPSICGPTADEPWI